MTTRHKNYIGYLVLNKGIYVTRFMENNILKGYKTV